MARENYVSCITPYMSGKGKTKEERRHAMCIGAKICSGRAADEAEAAALCEQAASEPKPAKSSGRSMRNFSPRDLAVCLLENLPPSDINLETLLKTISICQHRKRDYSKRDYIKECIRAEAVTGSMGETIKLSKKCTLEWDEKKAGGVNVQAETERLPEGDGHQG